MKIYAEFLEVYQGRLQTGCGSDFAYILDGRNNRPSHIEGLQLRMHALRHIHPYICGYRVFRGERFDDNNELICEWVRSGVTYKTGSRYKEATRRW